MADIALNDWVLLANNQSSATSAPSAADDGFDIEEVKVLYFRVSVGTATSWAASVWLYAGPGPNWEPLADGAMSGAANGDTIKVYPGPADRAYLQLTSVAGGHVDLEAFASRNDR